MAKLIGMLSENVKRLKLVECKFDEKGSLILISGENDQGKSSLLDSIEMALTGAKTIPKVPINDGRYNKDKSAPESARIVVELDNLIVERSFANDKSYLKVTNKEGMIAPSPQKMLDELTGKLSFDPLLFLNSKPKEQVDILLSLGEFGEDPRKIDGRIKVHYDNRTFHNRKHKEYKGILENMSEPAEDLPDEKISITDINDEKNEALRKNGLKDKLIIEKIELAKEHDAIIVNMNNLGDRVKELQVEIKTIGNTLDSKEASLNQALDNIEHKVKEIDAFIDIDISEFDTAIEKAEIVNEQIAQSESYQNIHKLADVALESADKETTEIEKLQDKKATELKNAKLPVDSIAYDENGVMFQDLPFDQASDSDKTKISFMIAKALNPELKLIMSKEGDKLGKKKLLELTKLAKDEGYLFLIERIHDDGLPAIIIEDGMVKK